MLGAKLVVFENPCPAFRSFIIHKFPFCFRSLKPLRD